MALYNQIESFAYDLGANIFGVADLIPARRFILEQGNNFVSTYPIGISFGIFLNHSIIDQLTNHKKRSIAKLYRHHCYDLVNIQLDIIGSRISNLLQREGFDTLPIPASQTVTDNGFDGFFSHKIAAHLAGLGWIGKNSLLITPNAGPRLRFGTVLTNAPLQKLVEVLKSRCGGCSLCADICPSAALEKPKGVNDEANKFLFDKQRCHDYLQKMEKTIGFRVCGLCLYVCPYGRKKINMLE